MPPLRCDSARSLDGESEISSRAARPVPVLCPVDAALAATIRLAIGCHQPAAAPVDPAALNPFDVEMPRSRNRLLLAYMQLHIRAAFCESGGLRSTSRPAGHGRVRAPFLCSEAVSIVQRARPAPASESAPAPDLLSTETSDRAHGSCPGPHPSPSPHAASAALHASLPGSCTAHSLT